MIKFEIGDADAAKQLVGGGNCIPLIRLLNECGEEVQRRYQQSAGWRERNVVAVQRSFFGLKGIHLEAQTMHLLELLIAESKKDHHVQGDC